MKKIFTIGFLLTIFLSVIYINSAYAIDASAAVDVNSAYVWRGITFNDGAVVQPSADLNISGLAFNLWGNIDIGDYDGDVDSNELSEVDFTISYGFDVEPLKINLGLIEYFLPISGEDTKEAFISFETEFYKRFTAGIEFYYDFDEVNDYYTQIVLAYNIPINETVSLDIGASAGYAGEDSSIGGESGFHDYNLSSVLNYSFAENVSSSLSINYTGAIDEDVLPEGSGAQDVNLWGGINISYTF